MDLSLEDALKIVKTRELSDVAFFHKLNSLEIDANFSIGYSLAELRQADLYSPQTTQQKYLPLIKTLKKFRREKIPANKRILDYGSGIGTLARYLQENKFDIEVADNQPISIAVAIEVNKLIPFLINQNDVSSIPNSRYGIIMLNRVLEQPVMEEEDSLKLLKKLSNNLDKDGYFLVSTSSGIIPIGEIKRLFRKVEKININPTLTVRDIYKITP